MQDVTGFLRANDAYFLFGLCILTLLLLIVTVVLAGKLARMNRRRSVKIEEGRLSDIVEHLENNANAISEVQARLEDTRAALCEQGKALEGCLQKVGIVRFNAFDDVGGEQSFAVVLLDSQANGIALSGLYGRQDSRVYAKAIFKGQGERPLSDEEQQALAKALS